MVEPDLRKGGSHCSLESEATDLLLEILGMGG